jgi:hypothetical protein
LFRGEFVFDANKNINAELKESGALIEEGTIEHSYPHCWRCSTELVYRLVDEWFISMGELLDKPREEISAEEKEANLRYQIMDRVDDATWYPSFGYDRELDWLRNGLYQLAVAFVATGAAQNHQEHARQGLPPPHRRLPSAAHDPLQYGPATAYPQGDEGTSTGVLPGADDNASGVAGLLEVGRLLDANDVRPGGGPRYHAQRKEESWRSCLCCWPV